MADDPTQRPYRSNETLARAPARAPAQASGGDPLAELARLIGQNDPFSEFGRDGQRRVGAAPSGNGYAAPAMVPAAPMRGEPPYNPPNSGRQNFGGAPLAAGSDLYHTEHYAVPGYPPAQHLGQHSGHDAGYDDDAYNPSTPHRAPEEEDFYEDEHPGHRRMGVLVIAGIFALAVIGTAGAFGYRALFGSSSTAAPPPVIKADSAPSKIVPVSNTDSQSNKQITDRVNDRGMGEKLVSREEQPVTVSPQAQDSAPSSSQPVLGSGVIGSEPKRVRTIAIRPDQAGPADASPASAPPVRVAAPPPRVVSNSPPAGDPEPVPAPRQAAPRVAPPVQQAAPPAPNSNAPLSLSPDAAAPARSASARASAPVRTAAVAPTQTAPAAAPSGNGGVGSYAVQISSQRSEAEAQAAFRGLQGKFPTQLGGKQPLIRQVDLGDKGIYYRAMVGPFANGSEATELCGSLKAAGGQCIVQRN
jgi:hypothetical protein